MVKKSALSLIKSDICFFYGKISFATVIKSLINPSTRAAILVRLATSGNKVMYIVCRNLLIKKYGIDIGFTTKIGPCLKLPHPIGIVFGEGVVLAGNLTIYQNCTLGSKSGYPTVKKGVTIYPHSCIVGKISIGEGSIIGAMSFVDKSVAPHTTHYPNKSRA